MQFLTLSTLLFTVFAAPAPAPAPRYGLLKFAGGLGLGAAAVAVPVSVRTRERRRFAAAQPMIPVGQSVTISEEIVPGPGPVVGGPIIV